ncbi:MAG: energy-coupling factor transporter transmembrane protein EcfT [Lachnospiraceae bacterium]|nr:energy-coupling factor transporter transmembrane protein EcfT [Lachnospiraceae bacterium]
MNNLFNYIDKESPVHRLTGATKFVCLLLWNFAAMYTYDTRYLAVMAVLSFFLFALSRIKLKEVSFMLGFTAVFVFLNNILVYVFSPQHGTEIYGTCTYLFGLSGKYAPTAEQLFYHLNYFLKYLATIPSVILFVSTTNPSEFAASLNKLGVSYSVAYSVALALRYIPDVQKEYYEISKAQQARGIEMSKKAPLMKRIKSAATILIPLILTSMDRVEIVSNAMELRSFGKNKKRTWYMGRPFKGADILAMVFCVLLVIIAVFLNFYNKGRFFNPFI